MHKQKTILISVLSLSFLVVAGSAIAAMTFTTDGITGSSGITIPSHMAIGDVTVDGPTQFGNNAFSNLTIGDTVTDLSDGQLTTVGINSLMTIKPIGSVNGGSVYGVGGVIETDPTTSGLLTSGLTGLNGQVDHLGSGTLNYAVGTSGQVYLENGGANTLYGFYGIVENDGNNNIDTAAAMFLNATVNLGTGTVTNGYGVYISPPDNSGGGTISNFVDYYAGDIGTTTANGYYSWFDSTGVGRCKEDRTFNSVGQSICAVYNPQFTKYTPGAANYERIVYGQWDSNVAEIGAEAGGTGTLRPLRLLGTEIIRPINNGLTAAGSNQAGALALTKDFNVITTTASSTGVSLPTPIAGMEITIINRGANALAVYPAASSGTVSINALSADTAYSVPTIVEARCTAVSTSSWECQKLSR